MIDWSIRTPAPRMIAMPSPFPGMDPYLENPEIFPDFHDSMITYLREGLQANLPAPYFAAIGRRIWIEVSRRTVGPDVNVYRGGGPASPTKTDAGALAVAVPRTSRPVVIKVPHDERRESFIEIYVKNDEGKRLVTSIELLSLSNKSVGEHGRELYLRKQREILGSRVHLVEIDLLRGGEHVTAVPLDVAREACGAFDYHVSLHRFDDPETFLAYPIRLEEPLPAIEIPLLADDPAVAIDLQAVFDRCYDAGPYAREVDYGTDPLIPPLATERQAWLARIPQQSDAR
jgi:hypothetical protein